jgi:hypothetical protein
MPTSKINHPDQNCSKDKLSSEVTSIIKIPKPKRFGFFNQAIAGISPRLCWSGVFLIVAVILFLSWLPIRWTWISLNISAGLVDIKLSESMRINELLVKDLSWNSSEKVSIILPNGESYEKDYFDLVGGPDGEPITISPIGLEANTILGIQTSKVKNRFTACFYTIDSTVELGLSPGVTIGFGEDMRDSIEGEPPRLIIQNVAKANPVYISWQLVGKERLVEAVTVDGMSFWQEVANRGRGLNLSTVQNGLLVLEEKGGKRIDLREGEPITFRKLNGMLRSLVLEDSGVRVVFDGMARDIRTGYAGHSRSLMPTILDWLINIPWIKALLSFFAVLIASSLPLFNRGEKR